jgi:hypothetical protein
LAKIAAEALELAKEVVVEKYYKFKNELDTVLTGIPNILLHWDYNDYGIDFYWATIFYFKKTAWTKSFFDLYQHIVENYDFYVFTYRIPWHLVRNDYVVSIAIHIMNGFSNRSKPSKLPCNIYYILDRDELYQINSKNELVFFVQKNNHLGEYTLTKTSTQTVHIMNKYSFNRNIPRMLEILDGE